MSAALLPSTTDRNEWTDDEAAVVEAAGLVFIHQYGERRGEKVLAPRPVIAKFMHICERTGLDPLARQIYCIGRFGSDGLEWSVQTGIDGFRVIAERSKLYAGQDEPEWLTKDHGWVGAFIKELHGDHPLAARVKVWRSDWERPMVGIATWDEYVQTTSKGAVTRMWSQRGPGQLAKCAEALALRKAFPQDLSGLYTDDEMQSQVLEVPEGDEAGEPAPRRRRGLPTVADRARAAEEAVAAEEAPEPVAADESVADPEPTPDVDDADLELFPCSECGELVVDEEGAICGPCEDRIEAAITAAEGAQS